MEICHKNLISLPFKISQGRVNRHGSISYLWLPISGPQQLWTCLVYRFRDFGRKLQKKIPTPVYLSSPLKEFRVQLGIGARSRQTRMVGYQTNKEVWRYLQASGYNIRMWRTDRRRDIGLQPQRPRLAR